MLPLCLLLPVIHVVNTAIGCKAGTPALGKISRLRGEGVELIANEVCAVSLITQSQTLKGIVHTSTNRLEEKVNLECNHSWESED